MLRARRSTWSTWAISASLLSRVRGPPPPVHSIGHKAAETLRKFTEYDVTKMPFMSGQDIKVAGVPCRVTRCGYTGEDGYEISMPNKESIELTKTILNNTNVFPCGMSSELSLDA